MKKLSKFLSLAVALFLAMGTATTVSAANYTAIPGTQTELTKYLVVDADAEIPDAEFTFTVTAGSAVEATETTVKTWAGKNPELVKVNGTVQSGTVKFVAGEDATNALAVEALGDGAGTKKAAKKTITLDFSGVEFTEPGIYPYIITETDPVSPIKALDSKVTTVHVYVEDVAGVLKVTSYVAYEGLVSAPGLTDLHAWLAENPKPVEPVEPVQADYQLPDDGGDDVAAFEAAHTEWESDHADWEVAVATWQDAYDAQLLEVPNGAEASLPKDDKFVNGVDSANIKFGKEVTGNQGSKDQWFKFTLTLNNLGKGTVLTMDMTEAEDGVTHENTATSYTKVVMDEKNQRDDDKDPVDKFFAVIPDVVYDALTPQDKAAFLSVEEIEVPIPQQEGDPIVRKAYKVEFADADARSAFNTAHTFDPTDMPTEYKLELITELDDQVAPKEGQQIIADDSGSATVEVYLHDGMYVTLKGLPEGATYALVEEDAAGYEKIEKITQVVNGTRAFEDELSGIIGSKMEEKAEHWTYGGQEFATLAEANDAAVQAGEEPAAEGQLANGVEHHPAGQVKADDQDIYTGYTNHRDGVIPTGVAMAVSTGVGLVALASAGIFLSSRRKREDEE